MHYSCLHNHTPVEKYRVNGHDIYVKRDDMFGEYPAPPLAKLRGASIFLEELKRKGATKIAVFDTRVSSAGQGVAYLCKELGLKCIVGFPMLKGGEPSESQKTAEKLGAELYPLKAGRTAVCYGTFARVARERGYYLMPLGLVCKDTVIAVSCEARETIDRLRKEGVDIKTIVLSTGTGTIATGVHLGADAKVIGISCGMAVHKQVKRMKLLAFPENLNWNFLQLVEPEYDYYTALDTSSCPFRTSPYYDMKAWSWLLKSLDKVEQPCLFWNIGA